MQLKHTPRIFGLCCVAISTVISTVELSSAVLSSLDAVATLIGFVGLTFLADSIAKFVQTIDENTLEVSDFTLYVTRLPKDTTAVQVRCRSWGSVVGLFISSLQMR